MDRQMGFCYNYHTADSEGAEFMKGNIDDRGLCVPCCRNEGISNFLEIFQGCGVAILQFN
jgi:hypothetical protein